MVKRSIDKFSQFDANIHIERKFVELDVEDTDRKTNQETSNNLKTQKRYIINMKINL